MCTYGPHWVDFRVILSLNTPRQDAFRKVLVSRGQNHFSTESLKDNLVFSKELLYKVSTVSKAIHGAVLLSCKVMLVKTC